MKFFIRLLSTMFIIISIANGSDDNKLHQQKLRLYEERKVSKMVSPLVDTTGYFDANNIGFGMTNSGQLIDMMQQFEWPRNSGMYSIYTGGLWVGGKIAGNIRVAALLYDSSVYIPGTIVGGIPQPPADPRFRFYKVYGYDTTGTNPDYTNWPIFDGAPVLPNNSPLKKSGQNIWCVYNDGKTGTRLFNTQPLMIEVQKFVYGDSVPGTINNALFVEYKIINKGSAHIEDAFIGIWIDADLGFYADDLVGIDTSLGLAYTYNFNENDDSYGSPPPAVGVITLKNPTNQVNLNSFVGFIHNDPIWGDPETAVSAYNFLAGKKRDGTSIINPTNGQATNLMYSGNPVLGTGWVDNTSDDKKFLFSFGPLTLLPNQEKHFRFAIAVARGSNRLNSVTLLRQSVPAIRDYYYQKLLRTLSFSPRAIDFDTLAIGLSRTYSFKIKNTSEAAIDINSITSTDVNFSPSPTNLSIAAFDSTNVNITFSTSTTGIKTGNIIFSHNAFGTPDTVSVTGEGVQDVPIANIYPTQINFDTVAVESSKSKIFTLKNSGNGTLSINSMVTTNSIFSVVLSNTVINPGDSTNFTVTFSPTLIQDYSGFVIINHNGFSSPDSIFVTGRGLFHRQINIAAGWNLLSLPLIVTNRAKTVLFPTAKSNAFIFNGNSYAISDTLTDGVGFWLKFNSSQALNFFGIPNSIETVYVHTGWNMIGTLSSDILSTNIIQSPSGIVTSKYYRYSDGYLISDTLQTGLGYWIKVSAPGKLILSSPVK